jgi:hypothetical protein
MIPARIAFAPCLLHHSENEIIPSNKATHAKPSINRTDLRRVDHTVWVIAAVRGNKEFLNLKRYDATKDNCIHTQTMGSLVCDRDSRRWGYCGNLHIPY